MFKFFKKSTVENSEEIAKSIVLLSNGREASVEELINIVNAIPEKEENCSKKNEDEKEEEKKNEDEKEEKEMDNEVDVDGEKVSMKDLIANWKGKKKNEAEKEEKEEEKKNEDEEEDKSKLNEIKNAIDTKEVIIDTTMNKVARGQNLYGSKK